jgi:hypothetical protein
MKRVPTVAVKSLLASSVASVVAIAALALSPQPATAQGTPTITVSSTVPVEVSDPTNLSAAAAFAWNEFFALTWPALPQGDNGPDGKPVFPRGQPDTSLKYGDRGKTGQAVWETFRHRTEAFPGQGNPNGYDPGKPDLGFSAQPDYIYQYKSKSNNGVLPSGRIPPFNPNWTPAVPPFNNMDEVTQIGLDGMYAGVVAPSPNGPASQSTNVKEKILFEAKVNEVVYQYAAQPRMTPGGQPYSYFQSENSIVQAIQSNSAGYLETGDNNANPPPYISLPPSTPSAGKVGSIEIKASFRRLGPKDDPTKYYTATVRYYRGNSSNGNITGYVDSNDPAVNEVWGLTSLHIIQKTPNAPTFVFATFGHIDNILDAAGNDVETPDGTTKPEYLKSPPFLPALTITPSANGKAQQVTVAGNGMPPVNTSSSQLYFYNVQGTINGSNGSPYTLPVNISRRLFPIPSTITTANDAAHTAIKNANPGAVWLNYRLINVQARPLDVTAIPPGEEPTFYTSNEVVETNPTLAQFSGRVDHGNVTNYQGKKFVKNTYVVQPDGKIPSGKIIGYNMGGCMGCHGQIGQKLGGDFSVLLANGRIPSPDPIDIDENHPAVKRALLREYFSKTLSRNR